MRRLVLAMLAIALVAPPGCRKPAPAPTESGPGVPSAGPLKVAAGAGRRAEIGKAAETIEIPAGKIVAGSLPGDEGRDPTVEPIAAPYELGAFTIDALPYPGIPGQPPKIGVSQAEAGRLCAEKGARLCTEIEWERACRGPAGDLFSSGPAWDPTCAQTPEKCVSGYGVRSMGSMIEEWTSSTLVDHQHGKRIAIRGAHPSAPTGAHRCAARRAVDPSGVGRPIGFRCCKGPPSTAVLASIEALPTFRRTLIDPVSLSDAFSGIPELARVRPGLRFFKETEIAEVMDKAKSPPEGINVTTEPILWSPVVGTEILVMTGRSKGGAWIVALHKLPGGRWRLASSMIFANEQGPIVLAYESAVKREITWSMAWGAAGEGGAITYRDDHRVVVVQR